MTPLDHMNMPLHRGRNAPRLNRPCKSTGFVRVGGVVLLALVAGFSLWTWMSARAEPAETVAWQTDYKQALALAAKSGKPVFLDFTAAWCLSCQFNERAVLRSADVENALRTHNFVLLKADWTNSDPVITQKLASLGRAGVPTYVLYPATAGSAPDVLPELLTKGLVLAAIERDAKP